MKRLMMWVRGMRAREYVTAERSWGCLVAFACLSALALLSAEWRNGRHDERARDRLWRSPGSIAQKPGAVQAVDLGGRQDDRPVCASGDVSSEPSGPIARQHGDLIAEAQSVEVGGAFRLHDERPVLIEGDGVHGFAPLIGAQSLSMWAHLSSSHAFTAGSSASVTLT